MSVICPGVRRSVVVLSYCLLACILGCPPPRDKPGPDIDERRIDRADKLKPLPAWVMQYLNTAGARSEIYFDGTLRCSNHDPSHTATRLDEMQMLTDRYGCANWGYLGIVSNDRITFENAMRDNK